MNRFFAAGAALLAFVSLPHPGIACMSGPTVREIGFATPDEAMTASLPTVVVGSTVFLQLPLGDATDRWEVVVISESDHVTIAKDPVRDAAGVWRQRVMLRAVRAGTDTLFTRYIRASRSKTVLVGNAMGFTVFTNEPERPPHGITPLMLTLKDSGQVSWAQRDERTIVTLPHSPSGPWRYLAGPAGGDQNGMLEGTAPVTTSDGSFTRFTFAPMAAGGELGFTRADGDHAELVTFEIRVMPVPAC